MTTTTHNMGESERLRAALLAFYIEGVRSGMEAAAEYVECRASGRAIMAARDSQSAAATTFFKNEWYAERHGFGEWTALQGVLNALAGIDPAAAATPNSIRSTEP